MRNIERILLVDDDEDFALLLKTAFELTGFRGEMHVVGDGTEAMQYLDRGEAEALPETILLDVHLRGDNGFDVLRWIRSRPQWRGIRVAIISGTEAEGDASRARELGAEDYLVKPLEFSRLIEVAEHFCATEQRAASLVGQPH